MVGSAGPRGPQLRGLENPRRRHLQPHRASDPAAALGEHQTRPHPHVSHQEGDEENAAAESTRDLEREAG
jgi:hypothetical protein